MQAISFAYICKGTFLRPSSDTLQVTLVGAPRNKVDSHGVNIMVAPYESGLVTDIAKGENKGQVLCNDFVIRRLKKLCAVKDVSVKKTVLRTMSFPLWESFNSSKCGMAVFVQNSGHQIFGLQNFSLPHDV